MNESVISGDDHQLHNEDDHHRRCRCCSCPFCYPHDSVARIASCVVCRTDYWPLRISRIDTNQLNRSEANGRSTRTHSPTHNIAINSVTFHFDSFLCGIVRKSWSRSRRRRMKMVPNMKCNYVMNEWLWLTENRFRNQHRMMLLPFSTGGAPVDQGTTSTTTNNNNN